MKRHDPSYAAMMDRVHSLAVAAMMAATANICPGSDITPAAWEDVPGPLRGRLARALESISEHDAEASAAARARSTPAGSTRAAAAACSRLTPRTRST